MKTTGHKDLRFNRKHKESEMTPEEYLEAQREIEKAAGIFMKLRKSVSDEKLAEDCSSLFTNAMFAVNYIDAKLDPSNAIDAPFPRPPRT